MSNQRTGVENAEVVDLVPHDPASGECALLYDPVQTHPFVHYQSWHPGFTLQAGVPFSEPETSSPEP